MTHRGLALALAFWLSVAIVAAAQPAPQQVPGGVTVEQVARHAVLAPQIVDYEGTKILSVLRGATMETVTINEAHKRPAKTRLDFLSPEGVAGRLVVDDGTTLWHYEPRLNMVFQGRSVSQPVDLAAAWSPAGYRLQLLGVEEVIGRNTVVISISPRNGRRERRLWVDRTTGVALRIEERDPEDGLVLTSYFTRISFGLNIPRALFRTHIPAGATVVNRDGAGGPLMPLPALERTVGFPIDVPPTLPAGFRLIGGEPVRNGPILAAYLRYTDGSRILALFVAPASRMGPPGRGNPVLPLGSGARTLVVGAMRLLLWEGKGMRLTLVGPVRMSEMIGMAKALTPSP